MSISTDTISLQPLAAPIAPPQQRQAPVSAVGDRDGASNDRRKDAKDGRARANINFRAFLNAATFVGLAQSLGTDTFKADATEDSPRQTARAVKLPERDEPPVLSGEESERLYRSAQTASQTKNVRAPEFLAATSRYAKSFFAVSGTYARPGESLELTA